jgi:serine/threonine protein kinase
MNPHERAFAMSEVKCLSECKHPNIIKFIADYEADGSILLVVELALGGDLALQLQARAQNRAFFKRSEALVVFCQIFLAIDYIHSCKMLHRDIKAENIFVTTTGVLKVGDFGFTRKYELTLSRNPGETFCGTPYYLSPEICNHQAYGKKADLWSVGVVLYEVVALQRPFAGKTLAEIMGSIVSGTVPPLLSINPEIGDDVAKLCHSLLCQDPESRPSLARIFRLPFIRHALSDLRIAVKANTKIPLEDRDAMMRHIETVLGGMHCTMATYESRAGELFCNSQGDVCFQVLCDQSVDESPISSTPNAEILLSLGKITNLVVQVGEPANVLVIPPHQFVMAINKEVQQWVTATKKP